MTLILDARTRRRFAGMVVLTAVLLIAHAADAQPSGGLATSAQRGMVITPYGEFDMRDASTVVNRRYRGDGTDDLPTTILAHSNTPRISADGHVMYFNSSIPMGRSWAKRRTADGEYDSDVYYTVRTTLPDGREEWGDPVNLGALINTSEDDAVEAISTSGSTIYFSSLTKEWVHDGGPFYSADLDGNAWKNVKGFGGGIAEFFLTADRFKIFGSSINSDGDVFYFATTAHSPSGQHEIWVSNYANGSWQYPENLGAPINGDGGSYAPFIAADGKTLYFASARSGGYGGDDIYMSVRNGTRWQTPVNLGSGINTPGDETFFSIPAYGDRVYFSRSAHGSPAATIVDASLTQQFMPSGVVLLSGSVVDRASCLPIHATVTIEDLSAKTTTSRAVGTGVDNRFVVVLHPGRDYGISVTAPGYGFVSTRYTIPAETNNRELHNDIELERIVAGNTFALNNIFFDYKADSLRTESHSELDRLIDLMGRYSAMSIEIDGHTDNIGSPRYNEVLSERRAEIVRNYLVAHGEVKSDRIHVHGLGSRNPLAPNTSDEGRQRNRAVSFRITSM